MANYYSDHPEIEFHLNHPLMKRVVDLKERNYAEKDQFEDAPVNYEDAIENYKRLLDITGDVAANIIEPNSEDVDLEGPHLENGRMIYASKTFENLDATRKAGLWGLSMPRRYGGLNLPNAFSNLRVIKQVGRNLLRVGIDFCEETEPQDHHALIGYVLFSYYFVYLLKNY